MSTEFLGFVNFCFEEKRRDKSRPIFNNNLSCVELSAHPTTEIVDYTDNLFSERSIRLVNLDKRPDAFNTVFNNKQCKM